MKERIYKKNNSGITLIALIITIIVLLILAGVSISMITGENGILTQTSTAKIEYLMASDKEHVDLIVMGEQTENNGKRIFEEIYDALAEDMNKKRTVKTINYPSSINETANQIVGETINGYGYVIDIDTGKVTIIKDIKSKFTINYYEPDGSGIAESDTDISFGSIIKIKNVKDEFANIEENGELISFVGWSKQINADTIQYRVDDEIVVTGNINLYPQYASETYTVSFESNGGSDCESQNATCGRNYGPLPSTTKTGYNFDGWYKDSSLTTLVTADTLVSTAEDHTLYAKWEEIKVTSVTINPTSKTLTIGEMTTQLTVTVLPDDALDKTVTWTSSDTNVATVSSEGIVTAVADGTATITATANSDSSVKETSTITVDFTEEYTTVGQHTFTVQKTGYYTLNVYGAEGGTYYGATSPTAPGKGGYATGKFYLTEGTDVYIYVGGKGTTPTNYNQSPKGGANGGGDGANHSTRGYSGGGGATHIATESGTLPSIRTAGNISKVLIVAGGGGGSFGGTNFSGSDNLPGGAGGGTTGLLSATSQGGSGSTYGSGGGGGYLGGRASQNLASATYGSAGGSSYVASTYNSISVTNITTTAGSRSGNGYATITYNP